MTRLSFTVPGQPVAKGRARSFVINGSVRHHTPEKTVRYESTVALMASAAMSGRPLLDGPLRMTIDAWFQLPASWPKKKRAAALAGEIRPTGKPDATNVAKAIEDACNGIVYHDDSAIVDMTVRKRYSDTPFVDVMVEPA